MKERIPKGKENRNMKGQTIKNGIMVAVPVIMVIMLFALRETLVELGSEGISRMQDKKAAANIADSVRLLYDYSSKENQGVEYTFLEFGATGCVSCRKMEGVMEEVRRDFGERVNVRFMNVTQKEAQEWTKYFGVAMIPTQVILDNKGREIFRHTGFISAEDLRRVFK